MKLKSILIAGLMALTVLPAAAQCKVVAHRGFWKTTAATTRETATDAAQNSIRSLVKADSIGCYGSEFDCWITPDGEIFVNHDPTINGLEIQSTPARVIREQRLPNGERISTLDEYLAAGKNLKCMLVCELKSHKDKQQEKQAVQKILKLVKKHGLQDRMVYITFSFPGIRLFKAWAPKGTPCQYLNGELSPAVLKQLGIDGLDYSLAIMRAHPQWFKQAQDLGIKVNVWTVNKVKDMKFCLDHGADFITTNEPQRLQQLIATGK